MIFRLVLWLKLDLFLILLLFRKVEWFRVVFFNVIFYLIFFKGGFLALENDIVSLFEFGDIEFDIFIYIFIIIYKILRIINNRLITIPLDSTKIKGIGKFRGFNFLIFHFLFHIQYIYNLCYFVFIFYLQCY